MCHIWTTFPPIWAVAFTFQIGGKLQTVTRKYRYAYSGIDILQIQRTNILFSTERTDSRRCRREYPLHVNEKNVTDTKASCGNRIRALSTCNLSTTVPKLQRERSYSERLTFTDETTVHKYAHTFFL